MPAAVSKQFKVVRDIETGVFDAVLHHGDTAELIDLQKRIAGRKGPIIGITHLTSGNYDIPVERLVIERAISIKTAAAGGNASLMTMDNLYISPFISAFLAYIYPLDGQTSRLTMFVLFYAAFKAARLQ